LSVCSLSSCQPQSQGPLFFPIASISSINIIDGASFFAWSKRSLTLEAHTHTNISTNSEPEILKNGTSLSHATALAMSVFHVQGGQTSNTHFGILAQISLYFFGFFKKSTISISSTFSSSAHATSPNKILSLFLSKILAFDFPKLIALFATHHILHIIKKATNINNINNMILGIISAQNFSPVRSLISIFVVIHVFAFSSNPKSFKLSFAGRIIISLKFFAIQDSNTFPLFVAIALFPSIRTLLYTPALYELRNLSSDTSVSILRFHLYIVGIMKAITKEIIISQINAFVFL
jgi:hypothetical protein